MGLKLTTAPTTEPVSLAEAKSHVRELADDWDGPLATYIAAARQKAESYTGRAFITQTWKLTHDQFPCEIILPNPPLVSVTHVKYYNTDGTLTTIDASDYRVTSTSEPARIEPAYGETWPTPRDMSEAVEVEYIAGYGAAAAVPQGIKQAMLLIIGDWFESKANVVTGTITTEISSNAMWLLNDYRIGRHVAWSGLEN